MKRRVLFSCPRCGKDYLLSKQRTKGGKVFCINCLKTVGRSVECMRRGK
jgi:formylmethanofuran dehydrogenase subunit E